MQEEFELTYLIKNLPEGFSNETISKEILDIYLPANAVHAILRVRKQGDKFEITKKTPVSGTDSSHQTENTIPLTKEEFDDLALLPGKRVHKIRYYYNDLGVDYEIDIFKGDLQGLVLVDIEFTSNETKSSFIPPDWILADVTQEKFVAGGVLCGKKYSDIQINLNDYNYQPIKI
jgi:CYTH domain-containing protein